MTLAHFITLKPRGDAVFKCASIGDHITNSGNFGDRRLLDTDSAEVMLSGYIITRRYQIRALVWASIHWMCSISKQISEKFFIRHPVHC